MATLLSAMIGTGIIGMAALFAATASSNANSSMRHAELRGERETIRSILAASISCAQTMRGPSGAMIDPAAPGGFCGSTSHTQVPPFLRMARVTADGKPMYLTGDLAADGSGRLGDWSIRVTCSAKERSLVVRAARPLPDGTYARDPLNRNIVYDWKDQGGLLFGGVAGAMPLCFDGGGLGIESESQIGGAKLTCASGPLPNQLCSGNYVMNVTFAKPYATPPKVMVTPADVATNPACGNTTDKILAYADNVTRTGFRLTCSGSPTNDSCNTPPRPQAARSRATCSWLAIGQR